MDIHPSARIANTAYIDRTWPGGIHIGAGAIVDEEASVLTHDMTRGIYLDTHVGEGSYLGIRAIVMPGITIGKHCHILAGAVVTRDVADGQRVAGNPAKVVNAPKLDHEIAAI
ncbi:acyltransferase [Aurantiacibacter marinus]|nr:DapH/DapD/GlmU-related protein [Aurantiacibacter marinus]